MFNKELSSIAREILRSDQLTSPSRVYQSTFEYLKRCPSNVKSTLGPAGQQVGPDTEKFKNFLNALFIRPTGFARSCSTNTVEIQYLFN